MTNQTSKGREAPPVSEKTALQLWVRAGGRCSFLGCNEYVLSDQLTNWRDTKHGNIAHIVAASRNGPRGDEPLPMDQRSEYDNLILVCKTHHGVIDDKSLEDRFPVWKLQQYKQDHEARIFELTACMPDRQSNVIALKARVQGETVVASYDQICQAMFQQGWYPRSEQVKWIDLTQFRDTDSHEFYGGAKRHIDIMVERALEGLGTQGNPEHLSIFALGSIPLLVYLGARLSNKVPTLFYQRHRDTQSWTWKDGEPSARYALRTLQTGTDCSAVALFLSLSGPVNRGSIPADIDERYTIYEIALVGTPNPEFLRTPQDLEAFRATYAEFVAMIRLKHNEAATVHLFPAVPAPVAVVCGRELLHNVNPGLTVYNKKQNGGFEFVLEVK